MPQNNPPVALSRSQQFSTGVATSDFFQIGGPGNVNWFLTKTFTIPNEFTSIEFVMYIRTILGAAAPQIMWYSVMTPGFDTITWFDGNSMTLPSAIAGGGANYPGIWKIGIGPAFNSNASTNRPAGDLTNSSNFVPLISGTGVGVYIHTSITTPLQMIFYLPETPAANVNGFVVTSATSYPLPPKGVVPLF